MRWLLDTKKDYYDTAKKQMRLSERIVAALPGFRGYKEKELRREADRLIRNHLYQKLTAAKTDAKTIFQKLTDRRALDVLSDMDRLMARFDRVSEKVNHASYGYAGFFDVVKIQEEALDRMIDFDNKMVDDVAKVVDEVATFKAEITKQDFDEAKERVQSLTETLNAFEEAFDEREEVILGVS